MASKTYLVGEVYTATNANRYSNSSLISRVAVKRTSNQTISASTFTLLSWDASEYEVTDNWWDSVTNPSRLTVAKTGHYLVTLSGTYATNSTGDRYAEIRKNSAGAIGSGTQLTKISVNAGTTNGCSLCITFPCSLAAGDYIEAFTWQNSAGNLAWESATGRFGILLIGES